MRPPDPHRSAPAGETGADRSRREKASHLEDSGQQLDLDDLAEARRRRDEGQQRALQGQWSPWKVKAESALEDLARSGEQFCADDLIERVGLPQVSGSPNVIGALFGAASRRGLIEPVGYTQSKRPSRNASVIRVWVGAGEGADDG